MIPTYDINTALPLVSGDTIPIAVPRRRYGWRAVAAVAVAAFAAAFLLAGGAIGWYLVATGAVR